MNYIDKVYGFRKQPPHPAQQKIIDVITETYDDSQLFVASCGNGLGKTHLLCNTLVNMCMPKTLRTMYLPIFDEYDIKKEKGEQINIWLIGTSSNLMAGGAIYSQLKTLDSTCTINWFKKECIINGQHITLKSHQQHQSQFSGANCFCIFVDEPQPEKQFFESILRLRDPLNANKMFVFMTPVNMQANYLLDYEKTNKSVQWITGSIYDNPYLSKETLAHIERMVSINPDEKEARLYGQFAKLSGRVFKNFKDHHIIPHNLIPDEPMKHYVSIDPHNKKSCFATLCGVSPDGTVYVLDNFPKRKWSEIKTDNLSIREQVDGIKKMCFDNRVTDFTTYGDKIFFSQKRSMVDGKFTLADEYLAVGLRIITDPINMSWEYGIQGINEYLYDDKIYVSEQAENIISAFRMFTYKNNNVTALSGNLDETWECPISTIRFLLSTKPRGGAQSSGYIKMKRRYNV